MRPTPAKLLLLAALLVAGCGGDLVIAVTVDAESQQARTMLPLPLGQMTVSVQATGNTVRNYDLRDATGIDLPAVFELRVTDGTSGTLRVQIRGTGLRMPQGMVSGSGMIDLADVDSKTPADLRVIVRPVP